MSPASDNEIKRLLNTVVAGGYCIGCGACASIPGSPIRIKQDPYGRLQADGPTGSSDREVPTSVLAICPFSGTSHDERSLAQERFADHARCDETIGYYLDLYAGYVAEADYRDRGSSGGMVSWMLTELLQRRLIDGAIHVRKRAPTKEDGRLFHYQISTSPAEIQAGAKSRYYPIELSEALRTVYQKPGRYALVGVPCFVRSVRLLSRADPRIQERIAFCVGLFCGHLKSARFADLCAWQAGIAPGDLTEMDFRKKLPGRSAIEYGVEMIGTIHGQARTIVRPKDAFYGIWWGHGFFKYPACDYCDDVVAETADISVGDAWLPRYLQDGRGTNIAIIRHPVLKQIVDEGIADRKLYVEPVRPEEVMQSQESNYRHRGEGLAYRLYLKDRAGVWRPTKRVEPRGDQLTEKRKKIYEYRMQLTARSHEAFAEALRAGDFAVFRRRMEGLSQAYDDLYRSWWRKWASRGKRLFRRLMS